MIFIWEIIIECEYFWFYDLNLEAVSFIKPKYFLPSYENIDFVNIRLITN